MLDPDGDGASNYAEYISGDPPCIDSDRDWLSDNDEINSYLSDHLNPDTDGDGMMDGWEVWYQACAGLDLLAPGNTAGDGDLDGLGNLDEYNAGTNPCSPDSDGDGMNDSFEVDNSLCSDSNPLDPTDALLDLDNDGLGNLGEYLAGVDPCDHDTDGDNLPDGAEIYHHNTDPLSVDTDGDGISDLQEIAVFGTDPTTPDAFATTEAPLFNYQGRLTDDVGIAISDTVTIDFAIFDGDTSATALWTESHLALVDQGIYNLLLGGLAPIPPQILALPGLYLELAIDGETLVPRQKITAVPNAATSARIEGKRLETGTATLNVSAASTASAHVDFAQNFASPPRVTVTGLDGLIGSETFIESRIYNVTTTGFDVEWKSLSGSSETGSADFGYYAFGE